MEENTHSKRKTAAEYQEQAAFMHRSKIETIQSHHTVRRRLLAFAGFPMAWFFMNHYLEAPRGFNMALFWPVFLLVTLWYFWEETLKRDLMTWISGAAVLAGSFHAAMYASAEMNGLNFVLLPLLSVFCLLTATRKTPDITLSTYTLTLDTLIIKPLIALAYLIPFLSYPKGTTRPLVKNRKLLREIVTGVLIAVPLVFFLLVLLANADAGFSGLVDGFLNGFLLNFTLTSAMENSILTLLGLIYFLGVVIGIQFNRKSEEPVLPGLKSQSPTVSLIVLSSVNVLYLVFTLTQLRTLYFPRTALTSMDQSIAQYARSGFFSLLVVLCINLFLLWLIPSMTQRKDSLKGVFRAGYILMGLFTANMIVSSFYKMYLYEQEYGYTYMRLFVKFALIFFTVSLILSALSLTGRLKNLLKALTLTGLSLFIVLNLLNLEGIIVERAAEVYRINGRLDTQYLAGLSTDAYPALKRSFDLETTADPQVIGLKQQYTSRLYYLLNDELFKHQPLSITISELRAKP